MHQRWQSALFHIRQGAGRRTEANVDPFLRQFFSDCRAVHLLDGHADDSVWSPVEIVNGNPRHHPQITLAEVRHIKRTLLYRFQANTQRVLYGRTEAQPVRAVVFPGLEAPPSRPQL